MPVLKPVRGIRLNKSHPLASGLVGYWLFNEGSGNKVFDLSGNGYEGTVVDGIWQSGKFGSTILFNDASTVINFGDVLDIRTGDFSYGIWFKANWSAASESHSLIAKSKAGASDGRYFIVFISDNIRTTLVTSVGTKSITTSETPYLDGNWHFVFVTIHRAGNMTFYIDGVSVGTVDVSGGSADDYNTTFPLGIGAYQNAAGDALTKMWFDGLLDLPIFYNRTLLSSEIAQLNREPFCMVEKKVAPVYFFVSIGEVKELAGTITAQSSAAGNIDSIEILDGQIESQSALTAKVISAEVLQGLSEAQSSLTGKLQWLQELVGFIEAHSGASGSLQWLQELAGLIEVHSGTTGNLQWLQELAGLIEGHSLITGNIKAIEKLAGFIESQSSVIGDIIIGVSFYSLAGSIAAQASLTAKLQELKLLSGSLTSQSNAAGKIISAEILQGSLSSQSTLIGNVDSFLVFSLAGLIEAQSDIPQALLKVIEKLNGLIFAESVLSGDIRAIEELTGIIAAQSTVWGKLYEEAIIGFYQNLTNRITNHFNIFAISNNFEVRYDNDPRDTPTEKSWLRVGIDYGNERVTGIGKLSIQVVGIFNVQIKTPIGIGSADAVSIADIITAKFRTAIIGEIINFQVPRIEKVGRVEDNYQVNVICPFQVDKKL